MVVNDNNPKIWASLIAPNPYDVSYWVDLTADPHGNIIKFYDEGEAKWLNLTSPNATINGYLITDNPVLTKEDIGLGNVVNLAPEDYPIPNGVYSLLNDKVDDTLKINGHSLYTDIELTKGDIGLGNVANLTPEDMPISTATVTALSGKVDAIRNIMAGAGLTGGGTISADITLNIGAIDDSIALSADGIKVDTQDSLTSTSTTKPLSAAKGKALQDNKADKTITVNGYPLNANVTLVKADVGLSNVDNTSDVNKPISTSTQNALNLKADLVGGKIPSAQLPAYVDDILEYANFAAFPLEGENVKLYVDLQYNLTYRWSGSRYAEVGKSIALGETESTAYRGDRGKIAHDHSQITNANPHGTTAAQIANTPAGTIAATTVQGAINELASDIVQVETDLVQLAGFLNKYPYSNDFPFSQEVINEGSDKFLIDAYLDITYDLGFDYSIAIASKFSKQCTLFKHDSLVVPATSPSITNLGTFVVDYEIGRFTVMKPASASADTLKNSVLVVDWDAISDGFGNRYAYHGLGISPICFFNDLLARRLQTTVTTLSEEVSALDSNFSQVFETVIKNQITWPSNTFTDNNDFSSFSGWGCKIGAFTGFNYAEVWVKNRDVTPITQLRIAIARNSKDGDILADKTISVNVAPGEEKKIGVIFDSEVNNPEGDILHLMYWCDKLVTRKAYTGTYPYTVGAGYSYDSYTTSGDMTTQIDADFGYPFYFKIGTVISDIKFVLADEQIDDISSRLQPNVTDLSEEVSALDSNFSQVFETVIKNQITWPSHTFTDNNDSSSFSGWGCKIGAFTGFNYAEVWVKNRDVTPITQLRIAIARNSKDGDILADKTIAVSVAPGEEKKIGVIFDSEVNNPEGDILHLMYWCNKLVTRKGYIGTYPYTVAAGYSYDSYATSGDMTTQIDADFGYPFYFKIVTLTPETDIKFALTDEQIANIENRLDLPTPSVDISLPDKLYAIVGDKLQLFFRGMIKDIDIYKYDILVTCSRGQKYPRYFEFTPVLADIGTYNFKVEIKDKDGVILGSKTCQIIVRQAVQSPATNTVFLNVGDSLTNDNIWGIEAHRRLTETGGTPAGLGLTNISFRGRKTGSGIGWEGNGGWTWTNYATAVASNPFWNEGALDFPNYVNTYMGGQVDCIFFLLTWNGQTPHRTDFSDIINTAKILVDHIHTNYPDCKMKIMGVQVPSLNGGMGYSYGATGTSYADGYGMVVTALNMNKAYQDWCNEAAYSSFLEFVNIASQFDSENNMPEEDTPVNTRSTKTEKRGTNGVHPSDDGYHQIGDAQFRNIVANYCQ